MNLDADQTRSLTELAWRAGDAILSVYRSDDFDVEAKGDGSPLTRADRLAHETIVAGLASLFPGTRVLSEESDPEAGPVDGGAEPPSGPGPRSGWGTFWLVDPLDGTKEFIKRNDEFTVNIALIRDREPAWGVVLAPALGRGYAGGPGYPTRRFDRDGETTPIRVREYGGGVATVVASRSHRGEAVDTFLHNLESREAAAEVRSMGSSLKLCLVAEGAADVYPRLGPTCEWDTAAAHAVVTGAGGRVTDLDGRPLAYNKSSVLNPWFVASGGGDYPWTELMPNRLKNRSER